MTLPAGIRGVLIDVDGTLLVHDEPVPGAAEAIVRLRASGLSIRATTNTTRRPRAEVAQALRRAGIEIPVGEVIAPAILARRRIVASGRRRALLLVPEGCRVDFEGVEADAERPDWVVMGDLGAGYGWENLNLAYRCLARGAGLLALHKNRVWSAGPQGLVLDAGPFIAAVEFASGVEAEVVGKPSPAFFRLALEEIGLEPREALVVGDDPETDGAGGKRVGCRVAIVKTGKFRGSAAAIAAIEPDLVIDSVADLA